MISNCASCVCIQQRQNGESHLKIVTSPLKEYNSQGIPWCNYSADDVDAAGQHQQLPAPGGLHKGQFKKN